MSEDDIFKGVIVPAVTPYHEDKNVDFGGVQQIFEYFCNHPAVDGIFVTGATGEYDRLEIEERRRIIDIAAKLDTRTVTVIPNTSTRLHGSTLELTQFALDAGFHTVGTILPDDCTTFDDVKRFFNDLSRLDVSIFIYQTGNTSFPLSVDQLGDLLSIGNIVGIKDSCSPSAMTRHIGYISSFSDQISVIQGVEMLYLCSASMGGTGVIGGGCNVYPELLRDVGTNLAEGNIAEARRLQNLVNEFVEVIYLEGSGCESMRYFLSLCGVNVGCTSRRDGVVVSDNKKSAMRDLHSRLKDL